MKKKLILRFIVGLGFFIVALIITAPASIIEGLVIKNIPSINVQGTSGGLWSGQFLKVAHRKVALKELKWSLSLMSLFTGNVGVDLSINDPLFNGELTLEKGFSKTSLSDINAQQSVTVLASHWLPIQLLSPVGSLAWKDVSISISDKDTISVFNDAEGAIEWQNASLNINGETVSLGTVFLQLSTDNDDLLITLSDNNSVLDIQGTLRFSMNRTYLLELSLSDDLPANIKSAVQMIARPDDNGRLTFSIPGRL
ncbi:MAG: type II secretion system protein N [Gammaproteobacteria bacterium]|nr:type II secretion system protein N [Gammaproteobacteria bacterium]